MRWTHAPTWRGDLAHPPPGAGLAALRYRIPTTCYRQDYMQDGRRTLRALLDFCRNSCNLDSSSFDRALSTNSSHRSSEVNWPPNCFINSCSNASAPWSSRNLSSADVMKYA